MRRKSSRAEPLWSPERVPGSARPPPAASPSEAPRWPWSADRRRRPRPVAEGIGGQPHLVDYSRLDDVRRLAQELLDRYAQIDVLANNAGGVFASRQTTADGHEMTFQVNYLAPFLLTNL